jgi:hypothetical protein
MKIRLTRKLADSIDGVDLSRKKVGRVINVARHDAQLLIAEGWGRPVDSIGDRRSGMREWADDRPSHRRASHSRKRR